MEYVDKVVDPKYRDIVEKNEDLKVAAWLIYLISEHMASHKSMKKSFNKYLEMIVEGKY